MKWFGNLRISVKLISSFMVVALIAGIVGVIGITVLVKIDKDYTNIYTDYGIASSDIGKISTLYQRSRVNLRDIILDTSSADKETRVNALKEINEQMNKSMSDFEKSLQSDAAKLSFSTLQSNYELYRTYENQIVSSALANKEEDGLNIIREATSVAQTIDKEIQRLFDMKVDDGKREAARNAQTTNSTILILVGVIVVAMIIAIVLGFIISRMISIPVNKLMGAAHQLADGELDIQIESKTTDEIGILASTFKKMAENLNEVMSNITTAAEQVTAGSKQVSDSSIALSQGATEQASSVEQLTASLEEISTQTKQNADNANLANEIAETARKNAVLGNGHMEGMLKAMDEMNEASNSISKIIKVIDEIAFQTNILALNAAVEAARAGQHGKGFAVVAEEVRNLAARSANAAKETTAMIEGSIKKVEGGTKIANETATALSQIVDGVAQVANYVHDIATASNEQATGISQINQGIIQVSSVIQTNSATSEESAAASEELSSQAVLLKDQVSHFRLKRNSYTYSVSSHDEFNPEMLRKFESINGKKGAYKKHEELAPKYVINLSDQEFGKY